MTRGIARALGARKFITALFVLLLSAAPAAAGTVTLTWAPNPEPDVVGYVVYWGTSSGQYGSTFDVGPNLAFQFSEPDPYARYYFAVAAYNLSGARSELSGEVSTNPAPLPIALTSLTASATPPQTLGTTITFTAAASGGVWPYEFKWLVSNGSSWSAAQEWSSSDRFAWTPTSANTNYSVGVWVRSAGSATDAPENPNAGTSMAFPINANVVSITSLTANRPSPQSAGSKINFTANATGASSYQFKWWILDGSTSVIAQEWSNSNKLMWTAPAVGTYQILVRARGANAGEGGASMAFAVQSSTSNGKGSGK